MDEFRESSENQNIITFRNLLDEENEFKNSFGIPSHAFWTTHVYVMIFTVISKAFGEKKKKKRKCLVKTKFVIYVQMYLVGRLRFTVFKRENLESHSHAIYKGYQNALLVISGHHGDKDMTKD